MDYEKEKTNNIDNEVKTHLLLTKNIFLTSNAYWINSVSGTEEKEIDNINFMVTKIENELSSISYGSAKESAVDFINNKLLCLNEIVSLIKEV